MSGDRAEWALLAYRVPRDPSTARIAIWRKLRRLGAAQVVDGLVALPLDARSREQLEWVADQAVEAGGVASVWLGRLASVGQERELAARMQDSVRAEYRAIIAAAEAAVDEPERRRSQTLGRLRREQRRVSQRDYFPPRERELARRAVDNLAARVEVTA